MLFAVYSSLKLMLFDDVALDKIVALCISFIIFSWFHGKLQLHQNVVSFSRLYIMCVLHSCARCPFINYTDWIPPFINVYWAPDSSLSITRLSLTFWLGEGQFCHPPPNIAFQGFCEFRFKFCIESMIESMIQCITDAPIHDHIPQVSWLCYNSSYKTFHNWECNYAYSWQTSYLRAWVYWNILKVISK